MERSPGSGAREIVKKAPQYGQLSPSPYANARLWLQNGSYGPRERALSGGGWASGEVAGGATTGPRDTAGARQRASVCPHLYSISVICAVLSRQGADGRGQIVSRSSVNR